MKRVVLADVSADMSGVEYSTLYLAQNLDRTRWQPLVICPAKGELPERCRASGIEVALVPQARFYSTSARVAHRTVPNPFAWAVNLAALWQTARLLANYLNQTRPDLLVPKGLLAQFYGGLAARWCGIPCVWHIQDRVSERAGFVFPAVLGLGARLLARHVIVDADSIAAQIQPYVPADRITVIWNGVDLDEFSPARDGQAVRAEWGIAPHEILVGSVARLVAWKGQHILLEAFAQLVPAYPDLRLVLVGSALFDTDSYARQLRAHAAEPDLRGRVIFAGYRRDTAVVLAAMDMFVHPALEKDSTPLAVVSAMASGKPIVCSGVVGTRELFVPGINGMVVAPDDADALATALRQLLDDPPRRQAMGRAARLQAEQALGVDRFARRCADVFDRSVEARGGE